MSNFQPQLADKALKSLSFPPNLVQKSYFLPKLPGVFAAGACIPARPSTTAEEKSLHMWPLRYG
jgi:hypothetical protein